MRPLLPFCFLLLTFTAATAQPCTPDDEIDRIPGKFEQQKTNEIGGGSYCDGNATALKTLKAIQAVVAKNFMGDGSLAKGFFSANSADYFEETFLAGYSYAVGFYQLICRDGKINNAHEYGTKLEIDVNPIINPGETFISAQNSDDRGFKIPGSYKGLSNQIPLFRYMVFKKPEEIEKFNNGTGYIDGPRMPAQFNDPNPAITRYWYLTPPGKKVLIPVTRKEFLNSLLEFYEKELPQHIREMNRLIRIDSETLKQYEKDKDKDPKAKKNYDQFLERIEKYRKDSLHYQKSYMIKKEKVNAILSSHNSDWLAEPAIVTRAQLDPGYCRCETSEDYKRSGCYTFNSFAEDGDGLTVYKWNPDVFNPMKPCEPALITVSLRFKYDIPFSERIRDHYTENLDFEALRKLLISK